MWCGHNLPPLVGKGFKELPDSEGAKALPAPPPTTALHPPALLIKGFHYTLKWGYI